MASNKAIRMNVNNWTYADFIDFTNAIRTGDNQKLFSLAAQIIVGWDYDVDLSKPDPMMELGVVESGKAIGSIFETINRVVEDLPTNDVVVDFGKWNTRKFLEFDDARRAGNIRKAERMAREIVRFVNRPVAVEDDAGEPELFSFEDGAKVFKAINEAYSRLVTGKG